MWDMIETTLAKGVEFDPSSNLAMLWRPSVGEFPNIVVDPRRSFGQPVIEKPGVPTSALFKQWRAERGNISRVAKWYGVSEEDATEAIEFELKFAA